MTKVVERIFEKQLRKQVKINEMQMRFMPRKGTIYAIFLVREMMEKYMAKGRHFFMVFRDLEKSFDQIFRKVIGWVLQQKDVVERESSP